MISSFADSDFAEFLRRSRSALLAATLLLAVLVFVIRLSPGAFSYFDFSNMVGSGASLALAAMGQALVVLTGGFDLSAGAVVSLTNVVVASDHGGFGLLADRRRAPCADDRGGGRRREWLLHRYPADAVDRRHALDSVRGPGTGAARSPDARWVGAAELHQRILGRRDPQSGSGAARRCRRRDRNLAAS